MPRSTRAIHEQEPDFEIPHPVGSTPRDLRVELRHRDGLVCFESTERSISNAQEREYFIPRVQAVPPPAMHQQHEGPNSSSAVFGIQMAARFVAVLANTDQPLKSRDEIDKFVHENLDIVVACRIAATILHVDV